MEAISTGPALLGELASTYQVAFRLEPAQVNVVGREVEVGLELELTGSHDARGTACTRGCVRCRQVLMVLMEIADWAVPTRSHGSVGRGSYEKVVRYAMSESSSPQVVLGIQIVGRRAFREADDGWGLQFLMHIQGFLQSLGCRPMAAHVAAEEVRPAGATEGLAEARV